MEYHPRPSSLASVTGIQDPLFLDFLTSLLQMDPNQRPTAKAALEHPWLKQEMSFEPYF